jgi:phage terminase large subunit GpA-like protein
VRPDVLERLTAEQLVTRKGKYGLPEQTWEVMVGRRNEDNDIALYSRALAHHIGDGMTLEQWASLAASHGAGPEDMRRDMGALWAPPSAESVPTQPA